MKIHCGLSRFNVVLSLFCLLLAIPTLTSCSFDQREHGDGKITVYSGRPKSFLRPIIAEFTRQTGIKVTVQWGDSVKLAEKILDKGGEHSADIYLSGEAASLQNLATHKALAPIPRQITGKVTQKYRGSSWIGVSGQVNMLVYNPTLLSSQQLPTSIHQLTDPQWNGKIGIAPGTDTFRGLIAVMDARSGESASSEFTTGIAANNVHIRKTPAQVLDDVKAGKYPVGVIDQSTWFRQRLLPFFLPPKAAAQFFQPRDDGCALNISGAAITAKAARDKDARHFLAYLVSVEVQANIADHRYEYPLALQAKPTNYLPSIEKFGPPAVDFTKMPAPSHVVDVIQQSGL